MRHSTFGEQLKLSLCLLKVPVQFLKPGPQTFAVGSALLLGCVLYVAVVLSPHGEASRRLSVLALSPTGKWLAGGTPEGNINIWDLQSASLPNKVVESVGKLNDLRFSKNSEYLAVADKNITLVPLSTGGEPHVVRSDEANYGSVRFSSDGRSLLTVNGKGAVMIIDLATGAANPGYCCTSIWGEVEFSPDGMQVLWAGHWPGVWDLRSNVLAGRLTKAREFMTFGPIVIDSTGQTIFMGSQDGRVYEWNLGTHNLLRKSQPQSGYVHTIAVLGQSGWVAYAARVAQSTCGAPRQARPRSLWERAQRAISSLTNLASEQRLGRSEGTWNFGI